MIYKGGGSIDESCYPRWSFNYESDLRYTPNGVAVATFTLAVNRAFANQQGEREADFINCVIWRKQAKT